YWYQQMRINGFTPDTITFSILINCCAKAGQIDRSVFWVQEMMDHGFEPNSMCCNCIIHACAKTGDAETALYWYNVLTNKGLVPKIVTYNCMIKAFAQVGQTDTAMQWIECMMKQGQRPDSNTIAMLKQAIGNGKKLGNTTRLQEGYRNTEQDPYQYQNFQGMPGPPPGLSRSSQEDASTHVSSNQDTSSPVGSDSQRSAEFLMSDSDSCSNDSAPRSSQIKWADGDRAVPQQWTSLLDILDVKVSNEYVHISL
ncbi:unnamed protein product, partial [Polarella glacialis]